MNRLGHMTGLFPDMYRRELDEELQGVFAGKEGLLYNMLYYQLGWVDEQGATTSGTDRSHLYALMCLESCQALVGDCTRALPAAAAVDLIHNSSLIHEDIQSGAPDRDQRPTVWWVWGPGQAINAGDGMHALARLALMRLAERGVAIEQVFDGLRLMDHSCLAMCEGQHMDLAFQEKLDVGLKTFINMASKKTGALMGCSMGLAALASTIEVVPVEALQTCGENLGIAHQIRCDIEELWPTSDQELIPVNVLNKKKLLPIVYVFETGDLKVKRALGNIYFKRVLDTEDVQQVVQILEDNSAKEYSEEQVAGYSTKAIEALNGVKVSDEGREKMEKLIHHVAGQDG